jgi:nucleoside-diphosphate-sugar epimerase
LAEGNKDIAILTKDRAKAEKIFGNKALIFQGDIRHPDSLTKFSLRGKGEVLVHLAACLDYFGSKKVLRQVNVEGTKNMLNWALNNGIKRFIFISSIEAMGTLNGDCLPADEEGICAPVSSYGESKLEAEKMVREFSEKKGISTSILRLGNVYGPSSPAFIVPIANAILSRGKLIKFLSVYKDRYLHPIFISDVTEGIAQCIQKAGVEGIYNLAGEEYITLERLFILIAQELGLEIELSAERNLAAEGYLKLRQKFCKILKRADLLTYFCAGEGRNTHRAYSIEKARRDWGFSPKVNLREGISRTLDWARQEGLLTQ